MSDYSRQLAELQTAYACIAEPMHRVRRILDAELHSQLNFVNQLCRHIGRLRGKMLRPALLLLSGQACGKLTDQHISLAAVVELVHLATLVHDDVLDEAEIRRQMITVNRLEGNEAAVLLGDYLISHAFSLCNSLNLPFASELIGSATATICEGELMQVHHRGDYELTEPQYFEIIARKTAVLTRVCCTLGAYYAGADQAMTEAMACYGRDVGVAFQIVDDVLDIVGQQQQAGKTLGRDLEKGKLTLPVIHFLATAEPAQRRRALAVLSDGQLGRTDRLRKLLASSDSVDYAVGLARNFVESANARLAVLPDCTARDALAAVARFVLDRQC